MLTFLLVPQIQSLGHCSLLILNKTDGAGFIYFRLGHRSRAGAVEGHIVSYPKDLPLLHWPLVNYRTILGYPSFLPSSRKAAESLQW